MTINNKTLATLQGLVSSTATNEGNFRTGMNDVLAQVNANQEGLASSVNNPQVITVLTSGTTYAVPADAVAIYIRASGGGGGGVRFYFASADPSDIYGQTGGGAGGDTTISNAALSLSITAKGATNGGGFLATGDSGGFIQRGRGAGGGMSSNTIGGNSAYPLINKRSGSGNLVSTYINSTGVGGKSLSYSIGAGGAGSSFGSSSGETGQPGYIEIWVW